MPHMAHALAEGKTGFGQVKAVAMGAVSPPGVVVTENELHDQRDACTATTLGGAVDIRALLAPEGGAIVIAALDARVASATWSGSDRSVPNQPAGPPVTGLPLPRL